VHGNDIWILGMHQCAKDRVWTDEEMQLLHQISHRVADGLRSLQYVRKLRASEERFRMITQHVPGVVNVRRRSPDGAWFLEYVDPRFEDLVGSESAARINRDIDAYLDQIVEDDHDRFRCIMEPATRNGMPYEVEYRLKTDNGTVRWVRSCNHPQPLENGETIWYGLLLDVTDRNLAEQRMRESEERLQRFAAAASESIILHDQGRIVDTNQATADMFGYPLEDLRGMLAYNLATPDTRAAVQQAVESGREEPYEATGLRQDGSTFPAEVHGRIIPIDGRSHRVATVRDLTWRKSIEQELKLRAENEQRLRRELDHRVRNNLSALVTLVEIGASSTTSVETFAAAIRSRLRAMATVHALMSEQHWQPVPLRRLVLCVMDLGDSHGVHIDGPDVVIPVGTVQALVIVLNEMMTNCLKYGALRDRIGRLEITWQIDEAHDELLLHWTESGGPPIDGQPTHGNGLRLIEGMTRAELRGRVEFSFPATGANHRLVFPLQRRHNDVAAPTARTPDTPAP
jgi:PAS domain S-box-containing protein